MLRTTGLPISDFNYQGDKKMKRFKKIIAVILAVAVAVAAAVVPASALDKEKFRDYVGYYYDTDGNYRLVFDRWVTITDTTQIKFYEIGKNSEETLLHEVSKKNLNLLSGEKFIYVPDDIFKPGGKYVMEIYSPQEATSSDAAENYDDGKYYFTYEDVTAGKYPFFDNYWMNVTEGETVDFSQHLITPVGFDEPLTIESDSVFVTADGLNVTVKADGNFEADLYTEDGDFCFHFRIIAEEREPENFMELLSDSFETLAEGAVGGAAFTIVTAAEMLLISGLGTGFSVIMLPVLIVAGVVGAVESVISLFSGL